MNQQRPETHSASRWQRLAPWLTIVILVLSAVVSLRRDGRVWWCEQGDLSPITIKVESPHNSQHVFDPYSLSHMLHGLIFFGLLWLPRRWIDPRWRLVAATAVEVVWELLENSPLVIERYRSVTVSFGYEGDSIINSLGDIVSFVAGYFIASKLGLWRSVVLFLVVDVSMLAVMRDNLATNVLMLLWPIDAVRRWQAGS